MRLLLRIVPIRSRGELRAAIEGALRESDDATLPLLLLHVGALAERASPMDNQAI